MVDHRTGDPLQVWKWPALLFIGVWSYFGAAAQSMPGAAGYAAGSTVAAAIAFVIGTWIFRKIRPEPAMPWWIYASCATVAGAISFFGLAVESVLAGFFWAYVILLTLAAIGHFSAGKIGLRKTAANQHT